MSQGLCQRISDRTLPVPFSRQFLTAGLVIAALCYVGKATITPERVAHLCKRLSPEDCRQRRGRGNVSSPFNADDGPVGGVAGRRGADPLPDDGPDQAGAASRDADHYRGVAVAADVGVRGGG